MDPLNDPQLGIGCDRVQCPKCGRTVSHLINLPSGSVCHSCYTVSQSDLEYAYAHCLVVLADIRAACGDNGSRMQPDLVKYIARCHMALEVIANGRNGQDAAAIASRALRA